MNRIQELRKEANLTQAQLATKIGVSDASINKYEKGMMIPKIDKLEKMAEIFTASVAYITGESDSRLNINNGNYAASWDTLARKMNSHNNQPSKTDITDFEDLSIKSLLLDFNKLNGEGKKEALKQVENLTKISDYTE
ncbi:helix-turn-helix domain-containing protein [Enterococcus sp. HY326]|uniref:helix-turn-helix domain-containing protein n=1 Tax=Enterococcus sp. HY326 TaxID=2971265 RepID=UPI002240831A|nr:helix-turn-helix transcriptional regulator [Enterococcus sp. HY326]